MGLWLVLVSLLSVIRECRGNVWVLRGVGCFMWVMHRNLLLIFNWWSRWVMWFVCLMVLFCVCLVYVVLCWYFCLILCFGTWARPVGRACVRWFLGVMCCGFLLCFCWECFGMCGVMVCFVIFEALTFLLSMCLYVRSRGCIGYVLGWGCVFLRCACFL